jgi:phosphoenolpyruvate-dependent sugar phosphotransferase system EIIA 2
LPEILSRETIRLGLTATDKTDAITQCGSLLVAVGAVTQPYADAMFEREHQVPTYLGEGVAIPHGTNESREHIQRTCLGFLQFPGGVDWDGERVFVCIPIASRGEEHVEILGELAEVLMDPDATSQLRTTTDPDNVLRLLGAFGKEN